jgi:hypothetical protein
MRERGERLREIDVEKKGEKEIKCERREREKWKMRKRGKRKRY